MSPWWVVTDEMYPLGPYGTSGKAQEVKDSMDCHCWGPFETQASKGAEAKQELRLKLMQVEGAHMAHRNFKRGRR